MNNTKIKVSDFINDKYREYWKESNLFRNTFLAVEQLMVVERRILWSAFKIGLTMNEKQSLRMLSGETSKYHISGDSSVIDSIKGMAAPYKRQNAVKLLMGIGNYGESAGDSGSAGRYLSCKGTPLLHAIYKDIPFLPMVTDETGMEQPEYISCPLPMTLINGSSQIGTGKSAYFDERDAREIIDWIEKLQDDPDAEAPAPISSTGCETYKNPRNGYTYYDAIVKREGKYDVITNLPPKVSPQIVMQNLKSKLPKRIADKIIDGSGKGNPIYIMVPKGYLDDKNSWTKYSLRTARKEAYYIWDPELDTMRMSNLADIANEWFKDRQKVVSKRINFQIEENNKNIHRIDLIKLYVEKEMSKWKSGDIEKELGEEDANIVLSMTARTFLPENLANNEIKRERLLADIKAKNTDLKNIAQVVLNEAREIIEKQEKFFK